jgi:hypothetical protein
MKCTLAEALDNDDIDFSTFYNALIENDIGNFDNVNSTEIIEMYITDMMKTGIHVSHILKELETEYSEQELWCIDLGCSLNTPIPINTKQDLTNGLGLWDEEELSQEIVIED